MATVIIEDAVEKKTFKDRVKEAGKKVKDGMKNAGDKFVNYLNEHDEMVRPIVMGGVALIGGIICGFANVETMEKTSCRVEDDISGLDFRTKHSLTNAEILELDSRMIDGDSMGEALNDMGLLKKEKRRR